MAFDGVNLASAFSEFERSHFCEIKLNASSMNSVDRCEDQERNMSKTLDLKLVVRNLANGSIVDHLCVVCLTQLEVDKYESIYSIISKVDQEFCIADVLDKVCQVQFHNSEYYNICTDCFSAAKSAYKFYLKVKQTEEILNFYTDELLSSISNVEVTTKDSEQLLCIPVPIFNPEIKDLDLSLEGIGKKPELIESEDIPVIKDRKKRSSKMVDDLKRENKEMDEDYVLIINEKKERKKRDPASYMNCSRCSVKYRAISKLKEHMKTEHGIELFYCKICKIVTERKEEYEEHLLTHEGEYQCKLCHAVYKKHDTLVSHMEWHEKTKIIEKTENSNICEYCGVILQDEASLEKHYANKHIKKYTCYYCGKMYTTEISLNAHIHKHELKMRKQPAPIESEDSKMNKRSVCTTCGKDFVDERALLWHQRLHDNNKPYSCEECGRSFVSANRRNQHTLCSHSPPARRCPLCPALFHLRSMVNTHVKKVHLNMRKRRNRPTKHKNVFWKTQTVPIEELSVSIQDELLELKAHQENRIKIIEEKINKNSWR